MDERERDGPTARIRAVAASQRGIVTRGQLIACGLSPAAVGRRVAEGYLRALHRGVYLLGPLEPARARELAAVPAGGPAALLSHTSAGRLREMLSTAQACGPVHVTVPGSGRGRRAGIVFHRVKRLKEDERATLDGIPVTSPGRTLLDLARMLGPRELERAAAAAERAGLIRSGELAALPDRYHGRPGSGVLGSVLGVAEGPALTRSEAERRCLELLRSAGLPMPHANVPVGPYELDLFWPREGVALEIDGHAYHSSRSRFEGDRRKDSWLRARGIEVIRLSWRQITRDAMATAVEVGQILALARAFRPGGREDSRPSAAGAPRTRSFDRHAR